MWRWAQGGMRQAALHALLLASWEARGPSNLAKAEVLLAQEDHISQTAPEWACAL